jgi:hypothetical protein
MIFPTVETNRTDFSLAFADSITELKTALELKGYIPIWLERLADLWSGNLDKGETSQGTFKRGLINAFYGAFLALAEGNFPKKAKIYVLTDLSGSNINNHYRLSEVLMILGPTPSQVVVITGDDHITITLEENQFSEALFQTATVQSRKFTQEDYLNSTQDEDAMKELSKKLWEVLDEKFYGIFIKRDHYVW